MTDFIEIAAAGEIPSGRAKAFTVGGRSIAVYHTASGFFATDNTCPHRGGPLAEGDLLGEEIVCPWHLWTFNVHTGHTDVDSDLCVATHEIREIDGRLWVRLSPVTPELDSI